MERINDDYKFTVERYKKLTLENVPNPNAAKTILTRLDVTVIEARSLMFLQDKSTKTECYAKITLDRETITSRIISIDSQSSNIIWNEQFT